MRLGAMMMTYALVAAGPVHANGQETKSPYVQALAACKAQTDGVARLRCYDDAAGALTTAADRGDLVVLDQQNLKTARRSLFGFSLPELPFFKGDKSADDPQNEITGKIASARSLGYGKWQIKLTGGAVWETTEASSPTMKPPRADDPIVIKRGSLGSYLLRIGGQRALKGKRVA